MILIRRSSRADPLFRGLRTTVFQDGHQRSLLSKHRPGSGFLLPAPWQSETLQAFDSKVSNGSSKFTTKTAACNKEPHKGDIMATNPEKWRAWRDSNPQPSDPKSEVLRDRAGLLEKIWGERHSIAKCLPIRSRFPG
jgi:hypothetical protein